MFTHNSLHPPPPSLQPIVLPLSIQPIPGQWRRSLSCRCLVLDTTSDGILLHHGVLSKSERCCSPARFHHLSRLCVYSAVPSVNTLPSTRTTLSGQDEKLASYDNTSRTGIYLVCSRPRILPLHEDHGFQKSDMP